MAEEKHHHHHFHHHKDEEKPVYSETSVYSETAYSSDTPSYGYGAGLAEPEKDYKKEEKHHKHLEHFGELGATAATAFAVVMFSHQFFFFLITYKKEYSKLKSLLHCYRSKLKIIFLFTIGCLFSTK